MFGGSQAGTYEFAKEDVDEEIISASAKLAMGLVQHALINEGIGKHLWIATQVPMAAKDDPDKTVGWAVALIYMGLRKQDFPNGDPDNFSKRLGELFQSATMVHTFHGEELVVRILEHSIDVDDSGTTVGIKRVQLSAVEASPTPTVDFQKLGTPVS